MKNYFSFIKGLDPQFKKNAGLVFGAYFFALFSYPFTRSVAQSVFYDYYTAQDYSLATFFSVLALIVAIFMSNALQRKMGAPKLYAIIAGLSTIGLGASYLVLINGAAIAAYFMFAIKEAYIVLLIHLVLAYANATFSLEQVKRLYGPLGAVGAIGGVLGGQATSLLSSEGNGAPFALGLLSILASMLIFWFAKDIQLNQNEKREISPLRSVKNVRSYVFLIAGVVALSQWVIFIADLQFNVLFENAFETKAQRTSYLGNLYAAINGVSLAVQLFLVPWILPRMSAKRIFLAIPIFFLLLIVGGFGAGAGSLFISAGVFVSLKGTDYSIFNVVKEVMYYPLDRMQKFGAKYITDMFVYRLAKALIAFVMAQYLLDKVKGESAITLLTGLQAIFIGLWIALTIKLFKEQNKVNKEVSEKL